MLKLDRQPYSCNPVAKKDFSDWLKMGKKLWPRNNSDLKSVFQKILKSKKYRAFICRTLDGKPIGFANVSLRSDYVEGSSSSPVGYLEGIFVEEHYRKLGVARMLLKKSEEWVVKCGCTEMGSDTELHNTESQKFHKSIGFREAEKIVAFIKKIK